MDARKIFSRYDCITLNDMLGNRPCAQLQLLLLLYRRHQHDLLITMRC